MGNNKGADQTGRMRKLFCSFVVRIKQRFSHMGPKCNAPNKIGENAHIKNPTTENELLYTRSDLPFEQMFDLLGKSARCLVCGKIMLKRNR